MTDMEVDSAKQEGAPCLNICFGSQTGTAESFADELWHDASKKGYKAKLVDLDDFSADVFQTHHLVLLIMATTGEGDPTDNAMAFHEWASDPLLPKDSLSGMSFAVFGCGDRSYVNFNACAELTDGNLERLGAHRIHERGMGDDSGDITQDFKAWKKSVWPVLEKLLNSGSGEAIANVADPDPVLRMAATVADLPTEPQGQPAGVASRWFFQAEQARVSSVTELRKCRNIDEGSSTVNIELDIKHSIGLSKYTVAGTIDICPETDPADIAEIMPLLGISNAAKPGDVGDLECCITFSHDDCGSKVSKPFPTPCSLRDALTKYCDLRSPPTLRMLRAMRPHLEPRVQENMDRLLARSSAMKIVQDRSVAITQYEFWTMFGADRLDLATFLLHCPKIVPRPYTIASSPSVAPDRIDICGALSSRPAVSLEAAVTALQAKGVLPAGCTIPQRRTLWFGLCSKWMCARLRPGDVVMSKVQSSVFSIVQEDVPIMMVGTGAGVAPFRAFWSEFQGSPSTKRPVVLFFGCRHPDKDFIYAEEMKAVTSSDLDSVEPRAMSKLVTAFSRMGEEGEYDPSGCCGEYVQDQLRAHSRDVRGWIDQGGIVYICGANAMCHAVLSALGEILGIGSEQVQRLRQDRRIVAEFWNEATSPAGQGWQDEDEDSTVDMLGAAPVDENVVAEAASLKLLDCVKNGDAREVTRLIEAGADVNFQAGSRKYTRIGLRQEVGETALHWAALRGDDTVAALLLSAKADPDISDQDGKTPLHIAAFNGVANVTRTLLEGRCDANVCDQRGNTPMQWVVLAGGSVRMIKLLLRHGARGDIANKDGEYAADVAADQGSEMVVDLIRESMHTT